MNASSRRALGLVSLVVAVVCSGLGVWQLDRLGETRAENARRRARVATPPLRLGVARGEGPGPSSEGSAAGGVAETLSPVDSLAWRRIEARGRLAYDREIVLAPRSWEGTPAVYLLTPLVVGDSLALPVLRGAIPSPDGFHAPLELARPRALERDETVRVRGLVLPAEPVSDPHRPDTLRADGEAHPVLRELDPETIDRLLPWRVPPLYVHADSTTASIPLGPGPALPLSIPEPTLGEGSHLSYAIQWFSFAAIALVGGGVIWFRSA